MDNTVYLFGAGINRAIKDPDGLRPPLAKDFFMQALKHPRCGNQHYRDRVSGVFDYIQQHWKLSAEQLHDTPFDLEECFTLLQLQAAEAQRRRDQSKLIELFDIEYRLTLMLAEYLSDMEIFSMLSQPFLALGQLLYAEKPAIITFNYDTLLESAIEAASGACLTASDITNIQNARERRAPSEQPHYSVFNWQRPLAYNVHFDKIACQNERVTAEEFYTHTDNKFYKAPLLKLHGSINWFVYTGVTPAVNSGHQLPHAAILFS